MNKAWAALTACFGLAACAGGGGGGGGGVAAPGVTATAAPVVNTSLVNLQANQSFANAGAGISTNFNKLTVFSSSTVLTSATAEAVAISYDASTSSYTISRGGLTETFRPRDKDLSQSNAAATAYEIKSGSIQSDLILFNSGPGNPNMVLTYASYGAWQRINDSGSNLGITQSFFVYGIPTTAA